MITNPHKPYIIDEASGIEVANREYIAWQEGQSAGFNHGFDEGEAWGRHSMAKEMQRAINSQGGYLLCPHCGIHLKNSEEMLHEKHDVEQCGKWHSPKPENLGKPR